MERERLLSKPEELDQWKHLPATKEFLTMLAERRSHLMEQWATGQPLGEAEQAQAVTLTKLLNLSSEDFGGDGSAAS